MKSVTQHCIDRMCMSCDGKDKCPPIVDDKLPETRNGIKDRFRVQRLKNGVWIGSPGFVPAFHNPDDCGESRALQLAGWGKQDYRTPHRVLEYSEQGVVVVYDGTNETGYTQIEFEQAVEVLIIGFVFSMIVVGWIIFIVSGWYPPWDADLWVYWIGGTIICTALTYPLV